MRIHGGSDGSASADDLPPGGSRHANGSQTVSPSVPPSPPRASSSQKTSVKSKRIRRRALTISCPCSLLLLACQSPVARSSLPPIRGVGQIEHRSRRTRRRNNTAFYYGLRDDDILIGSPPATKDSPSYRSGRYHAPAAMCDAPRSTVTRDGGDGRTPPHDRPVEDALQHEGEAMWRIATNYCKHFLSWEGATIASSAMDLRDRLARRLSKPSIVTYMEQQQEHHPLLQQLSKQWQRQRPHWNLHRLGGNNAIPTLHSSSTAAASEASNRPGPPPPRQPCNGEDATIVSASSVSSIISRGKERQRHQAKAKKRRKNNTGFYYGIRDDVLYAPSADPPGERNRGRGNRDKGEAKNKRDKEAAKNKAKNKKVGVDGLAQQQQGRKAGPSPPTNSNKDYTTTPDNDENTPDLPSESRFKQKRNRHQRRKNGRDEKAPGRGEKSPGMPDLAAETLSELRGMREEIAALREELRVLRREQGGGGVDGLEEKNPPGKQQRQEKPSGEDGPESLSPAMPEQEDWPSPSRSRKGQRREKFERIGRDVERWAIDLLFRGQEEDEDIAATIEKRSADGWKEIACNALVRQKFNKDGRTQVYLKWMPDPRDDEDIESSVTPSGGRGQRQQRTHSGSYPCLKCYTTVDAPIHRVCSFLADEHTIPLYNELVVDHADVEELSPNSKITWTRVPRILFVKPRDFVTYCSHWWYRDGTQVLVNQACEHDDRPGVMMEGQGDVCRGFAIRGANFISKDPNDPNKTRIAIVSHATPGGGLPQWAMNTAVNAVVAVEPFAFLHRINENACTYYEQDDSHSQPTIDVGNNLTGRSSKPAGMAHLGFTCFWPKGGGPQNESNDPSTMSPTSSHQEDGGSQEL